MIVFVHKTFKSYVKNEKKKPAAKAKTFRSTKKTFHRYSKNLITRQYTLYIRFIHVLEIYDEKDVMESFKLLPLPKNPTFNSNVTNHFFVFIK